MPNISKDRISFNIEAESASDFLPVQEDEPFRIALMGDFSGRSKRAPVAARKPILVDRDDFDEVLQKLDVTIDLPTGRLGIGHLDHFHPDHIYGSYSAFQEFRETRAKLGDPDTFAEAARDLLGEKPAPMPATSGLLDLIAGGTGAAAKPARPAGDLQDFIDNAMRSSLEARHDPRAAELIRQVDVIASYVMRVILNNPKFKAIEAAWRTLYYLVRQLESGPELKIYLIDITKEELASDTEGVFQILARQPDPWAVIAGNYSFGAGDLRVLSFMGKVASRAQTSFLAEADASLLGDSDWEAFRQTAEAAYVGLAIPRVLVRMPYGKQTIPCEEFDFEEISGKPDGKHMLFGSPAYFAAMLIGEAFTSYGWKLTPGILEEVSNLPIYTYEDDGESKAFPCAEIELTEEAIEGLIDEGFMPVDAMRNSGSVRFVSFQSAAASSTPLPGRWQ